MYKHDNIELSNEKKYYLERLISEYKSEVYEPDFAGLLEETFRKVFLDSGDISYLYEAFYLSIDDIRNLINEYNQILNKKISLINYIKNNYKKNSMYSDEVLMERIKDVEDIDTYIIEMNNQKVLKLN